MPDRCEVCGGPVFLHVNERPLCYVCGEQVVVAIESLLDYLRRTVPQEIRTPSRFITIGDTLETKLRREDR